MKNNCVFQNKKDKSSIALHFCKSLRPRLMKDSQIPISTPVFKLLQHVLVETYEEYPSSQRWIV